MSRAIRVVGLLVLGSSLLPASTARADEILDQPRAVFSGSLAAALPTGEFGDVAGVGLGGFMHVAKFLGPHFALSGSFGLLYHLAEKGTQLTEVPLLAGVSYFLGDERQVEFFGQVGIVALRSSVELEIASFTESETKLGSQWGAGLRIGPGMLRAAILIPSVPEVDEGFNFMTSYQLPIVEK